MLEVKDIGVKYGNTTILSGVNFTLEEQQWLMIVGPNGAGKTTLVKAIAQNVPYTGSVEYDGADLAKMRASRRARHIGVLMQSNHVSFSYTVQEVVELGRYAHKRRPLERTSGEDAAAIERALHSTGLYEKRDQSVLTLSGGELQRTFLAQLFAQDPEVLLLDEPVSHLDIIYQKQVFDLIKEWLKQPGRAVISVVHDLSLARAYGTHALLIDQNGGISCGRLDGVFTERKLRETYSMDVFAWMKTMLSQWSA